MPIAGRRVLVVEDEALMASLIAEVLREAGFVAVTAPDVATARDRIDDFDPDMVLLDISLGSGPTGVHLAHVLHATRPTLASNGSLSGTPTTAGTYAFTVSATNSQGTATTSLITITVSGGGGSGNATELASGPTPWLQSYGRSRSDACRTGWHASWAEWAVDKTGGWVCNRTVFWNGSSWAQNANEVWGSANPAEDATWDGK